MKKHLPTVIIGLVFLVGLSVMLYPTIADYFNSFSQSRVVQQYYESVAAMAEEDFEELFAAASAYNEALRGKSGRFVFSEQEEAEYMNLLNAFGNSIMGTLTINKIRVKLPIYHGTSDAVLQRGAGHLEGSSLPIGGPGTHSVISGHRGLPSSKLLTDLDKLTVGDAFVLNVYGEVLTYRIDQIVVVEPHDMAALAIEAGMDYCSLVTCTPYGINSHRMVLRGVRTDNENDELLLNGTAEPIDTMLAAGIILLPVLMIVAVYVGLTFRKIHRKRKTFE